MGNGKCRGIEKLKTIIHGYDIYGSHFCSADGHLPSFSPLTKNSIVPDIMESSSGSASSVY